MPPSERLETIRKDTSFVVDAGSLTIQELDPSRGHRLAPIARYVISSHRLCIDGRSVFSADRIFYQCNTEGKDLVVIEISHASANPIYWPAALSGHPVQFGEIWILSLDGGALLKKARLMSGSKAEDWSAIVFNRTELSK